MKTITDLIRISVSKVLLPALFTIAILVASISVGGKHAQAQTAAQTVADLLDGVSIPGLDSLPVSNLQTTDSYKSADITVHGQTATLVVFKPAGADKNVVAVVPNDFSLSNFVPLPSGTPLDDVTFSDMAFIIAQANISLAKADAPTPLSAALSHGGDTVTLKQGVNLFGEADFSASGTVKDLLSNVGITDLTLPLNGALPANLFSQNPTTATQNFKNQILDNLDLSIPLPNISIPGVPNAVNIQHTNLTLKGKNDNGTRSIAIEFKGELDITHGSSSADFTFDLDVTKRAGESALIEFHAWEVPGSSLEISMFKTVTLSGMQFEMDNSRAKGWFYQVSGNTRIRNRDVTMHYYHSPDYGKYADIYSSGITLADIIDSPGLPGMDDVALDWLQMWEDSFSMGLEVKGVSSQVSVFKQIGSARHFISWVPAAQGKKPTPLSPASFIPGAANTPLNDVTIQNMALVYNPYPFYFQLKGDLPAGVRRPIELAKVNMSVAPGLNVFGNMDIHPGGEMENLLRKVGVSEVSIPLHGGFSPKAFSKNISGAAIKNAILANLDLHLPLPTPNIPGLDKALTFNNGKMHIKGTLPDGSQGISVEVSGDADVHFGSDSVDFAVDVTFDRASGGAETELKITGNSTTPWNDPFGMTWIDLTNLGVTFDETTTNGQKKWNVAVNAKSTIGHHSNLDVTVNVTEENGVLTDATFTLNGPLDLSEVPGLADIPEVNDLTINTLTASSHGIEARTTFQNKETDFFAFEDNDKWVIALSQNNFTLTEIIPPLAATPLKDIVLSEAAIVVTQAQVNGALSSFGPIAKAAFTDIYQITATNALDPQISIAQGLNLIAAFEHTKSTGTMKGGMTKLGMSEERVIIMGDIGGIMGDSNPHVNLQVELSQHGRPHNMPKWMNFADNTSIVFSIYGSDAGDDPVIEIGIGVDISTKIHKDNLIFDAKVGLEFQEEAATLKFVMDLKNGNLSDGGTTDRGLNCSLTNTPGHMAPPGPAGWHRPFGIPGFTLYNVAMDLGIDEDGAIHLGFAGGAKVGGDRFCVAADADLLPEALGAPTDIAFVGSADLVEWYFTEQLALQVAADLAGHEGITLPTDKLPQPEFKNVKFAFVTPGASDPDLHIQGEGVALKGELYWLGKTLGSVDMAIGPTTGLKIDGTIGEPKPDGTAGDLNIGPIAFKDTYLDFQIPMPPKNPLDGYFKLNANVTIPVVGITEKINVDVTNEGMSFSVTNTILSDFSETLTLALTGVDLSVTHPDVSKADFAISGSLQADFATFISNTLPNIVNSLFAELNQTLLDGEKAITAAENKVNDLNVKINHERAIVRAEKAKVEAKLETAQARVDAISADITHDWSKYHGCSRWHFWCKPRWAITIGIEKGIKDVADLVLEAVEDLVAHVPIDFDPRVWPLIAAKDSAKLTLKLAEEGIVGLDDLASLSTKGLNAIDTFPGGAVNLKHASFNGDLKEIITSDAPVDLSIDLELFGADFSETFAFKLGDAENELTNLGKAGAKDSAHLALLCYVAVDHLFNKVLSDIPDVFKRQLQRSIGEKIHTTQTALQTELAAYKADFQKYHKTAQTLQVRYAGFADSYSQTLMQKRVTLLDKEPASKTFTDAQIELGVTGLCLTSLTDTTYINYTYHDKMYNGCAPKGDEGDEGWAGSYTAQKISTEAVLYTSGKKKGQPTGYVKINGKHSDGHKRCLTIPGKWQFEEVTYDNSIVEQEVFNPYTYYGVRYGRGDPQPYGLPKFMDGDECKDDLQFHWKVLAHGADYFQIHNRATQTCIWMKWQCDEYNSCSNVMEMIPCAGANTGVFRIARAIPAVLHSVGLPLKQGYGINRSSEEGYLNAPKCAGLEEGGVIPHIQSSVNWGSCDKPYSYNSQTDEYTAGYDTFDYFEDDLGRRRYVSNKAPGNCLYMEDLGAFAYLDCDSEDLTQWFNATQVIGGLTLSQSEVMAGAHFVDPLAILTQPINPKAGAVWGNNTFYIAGDSGFMNVAYTGAEQASSAIKARARSWATTKTALAGKDDDLAAGKEACVTKGSRKDCYRLGQQTKYAATTIKVNGVLPQQLTDGTLILNDDVGDALANRLATMPTAAEPDWYICRAHIAGEYTGAHNRFYIPGVIENQSHCYFAEGRNKYDGSNYYGFLPLKSGADLFWQPAGSGYLPSSAVPVGRISYNASTGAIDHIDRRSRMITGTPYAVFSCRAMIGRKTKVGWTLGGEYCHITKLAGGVVVKNFEVLTLDGSLAAPPPPPQPQPECTYQMVINYLRCYTGEPHCTKDQYNQLHPDCHFDSRQLGLCDGGPQQNDPHGRNDEVNIGL